MKRFTCLLVLAAYLAVIPCGRSDEKPVAEDKTAILDRFPGEWEIDAKWSDGKPLHARTVYEWGLGKKIVKARTFVREGEKEYQRYDSVMAWHPVKKSLYEISFSFDGSIDEYLLEQTDKDTIQIGYKAVDPAKPSQVRTTLKFLDKDQMQWTVSLKSGDDWKEIMNGTWKRKGK